MADDYPYILSNNRIKPIFDKITQAATPQRFTHEFLKKLGFTSSNDRAIIPLLKRLGFISETGVPNESYAKLKDKTQASRILGEKMRELYSDLYAVNINIHKSPDDEIKGAISRITGKDERAVTRYFLTFKALASLANFEGSATPEPVKGTEKKKEKEHMPSFPAMEGSTHAPSDHLFITISRSICPPPQTYRYTTRYLRA